MLGQDPLRLGQDVLHHDHDVIAVEGDRVCRPAVEMLPFAAQSRRPRSPRDDRGDAQDHQLQSGCYLIDGVELYRSLGPIALGPHEMVGLENCRSLDVVLIAAEELRIDRARRVIPMPERSKQPT